MVIGFINEGLQGCFEQWLHALYTARVAASAEVRKNSS